ncbi:proteasome activator complex subunit 3-like isoform X1 [Macrobrachium nipponense]|uniref:proteasome activator complex subunit 3-like isoform X1 n=1 Tax=Macrobrachium nipponense TaxID=159736 RepID=UPI0030C84841
MDGTSIRSRLMRRHALVTAAFSSRTPDTVESYKLSVKDKAEQLVKKKFPERIIQFNKILEEPPFLCEDLTTVHSDLKIPVPEPLIVNNFDGDPPGKKRKMSEGTEDAVTGAKVFVLPSGSVSINPHITSMVDTIKPLIRQLVEEANLLKMWVSFLIPKIEDGNNFGVSIQEETLGEIRTVESEAAAFFDQISRYYMTRAKLVSKVAKYPHIDDYRRTVMELDEKEYLSLRITLCEIRNHYATLHDMITKNMEKIKKPRSANSIEAMY